MAGIYHADTIRDVADALGIASLPDGVASMLASDVEYRLHQIIEEASRFTRHSKRTTLMTTDIDQAFKVLNIEVGILRSWMLCEELIVNFTSSPYTVTRHSTRPPSNAPCLLSDRQSTRFRMRR